jgi:anhydro-N-acetylmuramic acid kinase
MIVVAVASGTSADGLDVGVVDLEIDGDVLVMQLLGASTKPWPAGLRQTILATLPPATVPVAALCDLDQQLGQAVADVVSETIVGMAPRRLDLVVSPGQTIYHDVRAGKCVGTLQLGQPAWIAERTGLPVVSDLRSRDVAAGGHGAPLASTLDALWLSGPGGPRAALNLGGIANVSVVGDGEPVVAWDTGPANCLLDVAAARVTGGSQGYDEDGRIARTGVVRSDLLERLLAHPHFSRPPPVSTGREAFSGAFLDSTLAQVPPVEPADLLATLTELTAVSVASALTPYAVTEVVASGGGTRNPSLMDALRRRMNGTPLVTSDERGLPVGAKEVAMWALIGFLTWHGLPGATGATGADGARMLGRISPGAEPLRLPPPHPEQVRQLQLRPSPPADRRSATNRPEGNAR